MLSNGFRQREGTFLSSCSSSLSAGLAVVGVEDSDDAENSYIRVERWCKSRCFRDSHAHYY
jgi:hypothetical protein